jgi:hypothetical protein
MLQIVLGLIAIGITFFLWERFIGFRYLLLALVVLILGFIGYLKFDSYQQEKKAELKEFEQRYKAEMRIDFKKRHPEYDFPCNDSDKKAGDLVPEACIPDWDDALIDRAIEAEKSGKALPPPIKPKD